MPGKNQISHNQSRAPEQIRRAVFYGSLLAAKEINKMT
jgi:hypothetical protein